MSNINSTPDLQDLEPQDDAEESKQRLLGPEVSTSIPPIPTTPAPHSEVLTNFCSQLHFLVELIALGCKNINEHNFLLLGSAAIPSFFPNVFPKEVVETFSDIAVMLMGFHILDTIIEFLKKPDSNLSENDQISVKRSQGGAIIASLFVIGAYLSVFTNLSEKFSSLRLTSFLLFNAYPLTNAFNERVLYNNRNRSVVSSDDDSQTTPGEEANAGHQRNLTSDSAVSELTDCAVTSNQKYTFLSELFQQKHGAWILLAAAFYGYIPAQMSGNAIAVTILGASSIIALLNLHYHNKREDLNHIESFFGKACKFLLGPTLAFGSMSGMTALALKYDIKMEMLATSIAITVLAVVGKHYCSQQSSSSAAEGYAPLLEQDDENLFTIEEEEGKTQEKPKPSIIHSRKESQAAFPTSGRSECSVQNPERQHQHEENWRYRILRFCV